MDVRDYSHYLTPARLAVEEAAWADSRLYLRNVAALRRLWPEREVRSILEMGCGSGWVPKELPAHFDYVGMDANPHCLELARKKNPTRQFFYGDLRTWQPEKQFDVVCSFAVLKHFALSEWQQVLAAILRHGRTGLFTMPLARTCRDDQPSLGVNWPHVWVTEAVLTNAIHAAGHELLWMDGAAEPFIATKAKEAVC